MDRKEYSGTLTVEAKRSNILITLIIYLFQKKPTIDLAVCLDTLISFMITFFILLRHAAAVSWTKKHF